MKILLNGSWQEGYLDYYRTESEYRISILAYVNLEYLDNVFFVRSRNLRMVWDYLLDIGIKNVIRKIFSRSQEKARNQKYVSIGMGRILEAPEAPGFRIGKLVAFIAPCHPPCAERIVLPEAFIAPMKEEQFQSLLNDQILYLNKSHERLEENFWSEIRGWSPHSGKTIEDKNACLMGNVVDFLSKTEWSEAEHLSIKTDSRVEERQEAEKDKRGENNKKKAILFGYGNYAKVVVIPYLSPYLSISSIHEIDPTQIQADYNRTIAWDTAHILREKEDIDACLIAGYHHTHASLAIQALNQNVSAVIEKPVCVDRVQLENLIIALGKTKGSLFSCFHKRYHPFNDYVLRDIGIENTQAFSYHCIVHEVPLPELHWYRWPNSKSRLLSNGCHWIDHFLYLNNFTDCDRSEIFVGPNGTINCSAALSNGSVFTMVLTDEGSSRIGVQDYIEMRANSVTVKIVNGTSYLSENNSRTIRKTRINKMEAYKRMYESIGKKIAHNAAGDTIKSVENSSRLILELEEKLHERLGKQPVWG